MALVSGVILSSCDLLDQEVKIDADEKTTVSDSTTISVLSSVPDSTHLILVTTAPWHADVAHGGEWCRISKHDGRKGRDTIFVIVDENATTVERVTWLVIESGNKIMRFKVTQKAGETWLDTQFWHRTALERMGLHGMVDSVVITNNRYSNEYTVYGFDRKGNLLKMRTLDKQANRYDTTRTFTYDADNHRLTCSVKEDLGGQVMRTWRYEYNNKGKLVAYSARSWDEPDPLAEDMEGMIVPDLSYVHKTWLQNDVEFHEERTYSFDDNRLVIYINRYKMEADNKVPVWADTMRISYQYYNGCKLTLPQNSRGYVKNTTYYTNGMLKMMETMDGKYDYLENSQRMVVSAYQYTGAGDAAHEIDAYECDYNSNRDIRERRIVYSGQAQVTVERYSQYQYDSYHNWVTRIEEYILPDVSDPLMSASKREFTYFH